MNVGVIVKDGERNIVIPPQQLPEVELTEDRENLDLVSLRFKSVEDADDFCVRVLNSAWGCRSGD